MNEPSPEAAFSPFLQSSCPVCSFSVPENKDRGGVPRPLSWYPCPAAWSPKHDAYYCACTEVREAKQWTVQLKGSLWITTVVYLTWASPKVIAGGNQGRDRLQEGGQMVTPDGPLPKEAARSPPPVAKPEPFQPPLIAVSPPLEVFSPPSRPSGFRALHGRSNLDGKMMLYNMKNSSRPRILPRL